MIELVAAQEPHIPFIYECLRELRGGAEYSVEDFGTYLRGENFFQGSPFELLVAVRDGTSVGVMTCNRFAMPRYLGFGIEIEEVIVHPQFQNQGIATAVLKLYLEQCRRDQTLRKVLIKTDDSRAGRLYTRMFAPVNTTVYAATIKRI